MTSWNVLRCFPSQEVGISRKLSNLGFESLCPVYRVQAVRFGRVFDNVIPVITSYVFFRGNFDFSCWHQIRKITGVLQILNGNISNNEIEEFRSWVGENGEYWKDHVLVGDLSIGQQILIIDGIFQNHAGEIIGISEKFYEIALNSPLLGHRTVVYQPKFWCELSSETAAISARSESRRGSRSGKRHKRLHKTRFSTLDKMSSAKSEGIAN